MKVAVLGSGGGALAVAADMSRQGRATTLADFDDFRSNSSPSRPAKRSQSPTTGSAPNPTRSPWPAASPKHSTRPT